MPIVCTLCVCTHIFDFSRNVFSMRYYKRDPKRILLASFLTLLLRVRVSTMASAMKKKAGCLFSLVLELKF